MAGLASQGNGIERWPNDDFALGDVTDYGTGPTRYIRVEPWAGSAGSYGTTAAPEGGELFDGYQGTSGRGKAALKAMGTASDDVVACICERQTEVENGEVTVWPGFQVDAGDIDGDSFRCVGVAGRITGGTLTTPAAQDPDTEYHDLPDGYFFMQLKSSSSAHRLVLWRVVAGTVTSLEDDPLSDYELTTVNLPDTGVPRRMRMAIETSGSTVRIRCYRLVKRTEPSQIGATGAPTIEEIEVFNHEDTNAARVTGEGRWGVIAQVFKTQSNVSSTECGVIINKIRIRSHTGGTHYFTDEFRRFEPRACAIVTDANSTTGFSLMSCWTGDLSGQKTSAATIHYGHLINGSAADYVEMGIDPAATGGYGASGQIHGWYFWQNPTKSVQQHYSADFTFVSTAGKEERRAGIHLRGSLVPEASGPDLHGSVSVGGAEKAYRKGGYLAAIHYEDVATVDTWTLEIRRYDRLTINSVVSVLVASLDLAAAGLAFGTGVNLAFEARNFDANETGSGDAVGLKVTIDGTVYTPTVTTGLEADYKTEGDWLFDSGPNRVAAGGGVGFHFRPEALVGSGSLMRVDTWTEEAQSDPPQVEGEDQASIVTEWESFGYSGTFQSPATWPVDVEYVNPVNYQEFDTGHASQFTRYARDRRVWTLGMSGATEAEREAFVAFFEARDATEQAFQWTPPGETANVFVRMVNPEIVHSLRHGASNESFDVRLVEIFDRTQLDALDSIELTPSTFGTFGSGNIAENYDVFITDGSAQQTVEFDITGIPKGSEVATVRFTGTATSGGTHYTINTSTINLSAGQTGPLQFTFTPVSQTLWFEERTILIDLDMGASEGVSLTAGSKQIRFYLVPRSALVPPVISWDNATESLPALPGSLNVPFTLDAASQDDCDVLVEAGSGTNMTATTDYTINAAVVSAGATTGNVQVDFTATAAGKTLVLDLFHEKDDQSEENDWTFTETLEFETGNLNQAQGNKGYWSRPSNHGSAGTTVSDSTKTPLVVVDPTPAVNFFTENPGRMASAWRGLVQSKYANGSGYIRESFQVGGVTSGDYAITGIGGTERLTPLGAWQRASVYVKTFDDNDPRYENARFVVLTIRNREKDLNHQVVYDRASNGFDWEGNSVTQTVTDTGRWGLWRGNNLHASDTHGVVEETINGANYTRLWYIHRLVDGTVYGNTVENTGDVGNFIFRPSYFGSLVNSVSGFDNTKAGNVDKGLLVAGFMQERSSTSLSGAPPRYRPRLLDYWHPDGGMTVDNGGAGVSVSIS